MITASNKPASQILHGIPTGATYEEVTEALGNRCVDNHLEAVFHSQLKRRTLLIGESLQEFSTAIDHLANCARVELPDT
jgi:hypothetical protein